MIEVIKQYFDDMQSVPFPDAGESDDLADWIADLAELDGHIAGLAATALGGFRVMSVPKNKMAEMKARLQAIDNIPPEDVIVREQCEAYFAALQRVAEALQNLR